MMIIIVILLLLCICYVFRIKKKVSQILSTLFLDLNPKKMNLCLFTIFQC